MLTCERTTVTEGNPDISRRGIRRSGRVLSGRCGEQEPTILCLHIHPAGDVRPRGRESGIRLRWI
jgi:hypothetical protein